MNEKELKTAFAMALVRSPGDSYKAAFAVITDDPSFAMIAASRWPLDEFVIAEMERLKESGTTAIVGDKSEQAFKLQKIADNEEYPLEERLKAHELLAKIMGHIERPTVNNGIINNSNKVMIVRVPLNEYGNEMSEDEFELSSQMAQRTLKGN